MLLIISSLLRRLHPLCRRSLFCTAAMQVFSPVSLVFALHMIKTWNYKNQNRTGTVVIIKIPTAHPKMETITALKIAPPKGMVWIHHWC